MFHHFKGVVYRILERNKRVKKGEVVLAEADFKMMKDYIIHLEDALWDATNRHFKSIPEELSLAYPRVYTIS